MMRGLIEKELRQHGLALLLLFLLLLVGLAVIMKNRMLSAAFGSPLAAVQHLHWTFVPLACLVLSHALVVTEYRNKTQLFLEGLPLPRWRMAALKYGLGLGLMLAATVVLLAFAIWRSRGAEAMTGRFLALLAARSLVYVWFLYSLCFAHGLMGRYRFLFAVAAVTVIAKEMVIWNIDLHRYGPFALTGDRFAYERYVIPTAQLLVTSVLALFWTGVAFFLALARDATLAAALAERMSSREKMGLTFGALAVLMTVGFQAKRNEDLVPIRIPGALEAGRGVVQVSAAAAVDQPQPEEQAALERAANRVAAELAALADFLRCKTMPPVFLVHRRDLKPGVFESGGIKPEQGLMVRLNVTASEFKEEALLRWIVREVLVTKSLKRLERERDAWVLDGFSDWWPTRRAPLAQDAGELRAALKAMPPQFSASDLERWLTLRGDATSEEARALAATGLRVLTAKHGEEACRNFLAPVLGPEVARDARAWLREALFPVASRFHAATGMRLDAFVPEWREALQAAGAHLPKEGAS